MDKLPNWLWSGPHQDEEQRAVRQTLVGDKQEWAASGLYRRTPTKQAMRDAGLDALLEGWRPARPFIDARTRVVAYGSCFAARFAEWLMERGVNASLGDGSEDSLVRNPLENPLVVAQQLRWVFGELDVNRVLWIDRSQFHVEPTPARREQLRRMLEAADLLLITFGVAEYWLDTESGEPLWRAPLKSLFDPSRHLLRVATVAEVLTALETMERLRERFLPQTKIVFTLSPQKQMGTYRPISPLTASSASKAILRAALDEFLRNHPQLNRSLFYFPGFEMVVDVMIDPLMDDNLHLRECEAQKIVAAFTRAFSELSVSGDPDGTVGDELIASIRALESKNAELQRVCDERLEMIRAFDAERAAVSCPPQTAAPRRRWPSIASWIGSRLRRRSRTATNV
jgi:GSCFA family